MTFLAPAALVLLSLLAIPIVVHLFKPRKTKPQPFSSLRWLKESQQRLSRRIQWHQWLLFLVRAGIVAALVLALARPFLGGDRDAAVDRFVLIDTGRLMKVAGKDGTPIDRARRVAERIVSSAGHGDRTAVLTSGAAPTVLIPLSRDAGTQLGRLESLKATDADPSVSESFNLLATLAGGSGRPIELVVVTANHRAGWRPSDVQTLAETLGPRLKTRVIDVAEPIASNAWIASARVLGDGDERLVRVDVGCAGDAKEQRTLRLTGAGPDESTALTLVPGKIARAHFRLPADQPTKGSIVTLELEPNDTMPEDDRYFLALEPTTAARVLLAEPDGSSPYLRAALDALSAANPGTLRITHRIGAALTADDLADVDVVILAGSVAADDVLAERLKNGLGVIAFAGPGNGNGPWTKFAPIAGNPQPIERGDAPATLASIHWSHRVFASLWDPRLNDISSVSFRRYLKLEDLPDSAIAARFDDGTPAMMDVAHGAGRVLVWNASADDTWGDLPRARSFVPLIDRMLAYLAGPPVARVGEPARLPLPAGVREARLVTPTGDEVPGRIETQASHSWLHTDPLAVAGIYKLTVDGKEHAIAVNVGRDASAPAGVDAETLRAWWAPVPVEVESGDAALARLQGNGSWPIAPILVVLAGVLLLVETLYVTWLCPRRNPTVAQGVVPRHGILKPLGTETA
jgi:hypothetical protein